MRFIIICSYLLFSFLVFDLFAILSSEFFPLFSELFVLLAQNGKVYDMFSLAIALIAFLAFISNIIAIKRSKILNNISVIIPASFMFFTLIFLISWLTYKILITHTKEYIFIDSYSIAFIISSIIWVILVFLPLTYRILSIRLNLENKLAQVFFVYQPQMTSIIIAMCASAFCPYFYDLSDNKITFIFSIIQSLLIIFLVIKANHTFISYDYVNINLLCLIVLCSILCSASIFKSDFINAQMTFYMLGILTWCFEWGHNIVILKNELQKL